jgi:hypothetical protein
VNVRPFALAVRAAPFALLKISRKTECGAIGSWLRLIVRAAPFTLFRNSRKTERGAIGSWLRPIVRAAPFALLCACQNMPPAYAPPEQRAPFENFAPYRINRIINMADGDADNYIVHDVLRTGGTWRWTGKHPELRVFLRTNQSLHYVVDLTVAGATFKDTGPVTVSFFVNGHLLDKATYSAPGPQHFDEPVPEDWVEARKDAIVGAEIDKPWISPADGVALGFILNRIGLRQE